MRITETIKGGAEEEGLQAAERSETGGQSQTVGTLGGTTEMRGAVYHFSEAVTYSPGPAPDHTI